MSVCNHCGFSNPPGMRFCGNCGASLEGFIRTAESTNKISADQVGVLMGADLLERFQKAGLEAAGQKRNVTVLFADLTDYTGLSERVDEEDLYEMVREMIRMMIETVYKYEGTVDKILGDGIMALFGAPIAHENNAERAVRTALDMQANLARLNQNLKKEYGLTLRMHGGLNSGVVIVGGVGSDLLMDYTAIGDTVNLAHRLGEVAPPDTVLVSETVYRQTKPLFDYVQETPITLKGISQPVRPYRLLRQKEKPGLVRGLEGLKAPMIGREEELERLKGITRSLVQDKHGQFVIVVGEAGIGKSRLIMELKNSLVHAPINLLEGHSLTYRRAVSYWIFLDLLRNYLKIVPDTPPLRVRECLYSKVTSIMGHRASEVLPYLEYLLLSDHLDKATAERLSFLDSGQLRQMIFLAVRDLLIAEARRLPLLIILEDLHWADDASISLLDFLMDAVRYEPLMIYGNARPLQDSNLTAVISKAQIYLAEQFNRIDLHGLSFDQSERLLTELLSTADLPAEFCQQILEKSAGIPFYLEEMLRMLIDQKIICCEGGVWQLAPDANIESIGVPDTLQGLILARFDRLEPFQRKVLQAASVIGRKFELPLLAEVLSIQGVEALKPIMDHLVERAFIVPQTAGKVDEYIFRHVLTSDAVYSTLLRKDRNELHGRVAEAIEKLYAAQLDGFIEVLAGHYMRSPRLDRALRYLILAGQKSARDFAHEQARRHYEEALKILPQVEYSIQQYLQVHSGLGDVLLFVGDYSEARRHYKNALDAIAYSESLEQLGEVVTLHRKISITFERQGEYEQALMHLQMAINRLDHAPTTYHVERARIYNDVGWIQFLRGDFDEAKRLLTEALTFVEMSRQYDVIASIHNRLGAVAYHQRGYDQAAAHVQKSLVLRETIGDIAGVARLYNNLGLLGLMRGDLQDAEANFRQGIELLERLGDAEGIALSYINLGLVHFDRGNLDESELSLKKSLGVAEQIGHRFYQGLALMYLGRLKTAQGLFSPAEALLAECIRIMDELQAQDSLVDAQYYLAENYINQSDLLQAEKWVGHSLEILNSIHHSPSEDSVIYGKMLRLQGTIARAKGDYDHAEELLSKSALIFQTSYERLEIAKTEMELGLLARDQGNFLESRRRLQEARLMFKQMGALRYLRQVEDILHHLSNIGMERI